VNYNTPSRKAAFYISALTHPILIPVPGFIVFNYYNYSSFHGQSLLMLLGVFAITVVALPAYFVFALKRGGYIESYEMESLQERRLPLLFTTGALLFNYYLMQRAGMIQPYPWYFIDAAATCLLALLISLFYKISLHTIGMGFLFGLGMVLSLLNTSDLRWYLLVIAIITGIVAACRLYLDAHTPEQVYLGFFTGVTGAAGMLLFL
jgi:membrane-associated phospholipid phosphatase